jgi:hypothetical protein
LLLLVGFLFFVLGFVRFHFLIASLRRDDGVDGRATKRAREAVNQPLAYARLAELVVGTRREDDAVVLQDLLGANGASNLVEVFGVKC